MTDSSARALAAVLAALGMLALLSALAPGWLGEAGTFKPWRLGIGLTLLALAAAADTLRRVGRPRLGSTLALVSLLGMAGGYAWITGLGVHSVMVPATLLVVVLAGVYVGERLALGLAAAAVAIVVGLASAERAGALGVLGLPWAITRERSITLVVLLAGAAVTAVLLARLLARSIDAARTNERKFREMLELGADWYWELDRSGRIVSISPTFEERTGRTVAEFLGTQQPGGPQIQDDAEYRFVLETMRARQSHRNRTLTWRCADGTELMVASSGEPSFDRGGRFIGWRGVARNVSAEVHTRRSLEEARREMEAVFDNAAVGIALTRQGEILRVNTRWAGLVGLPREKLIGRTLRSIAPDEATFARVRAMQTELLARGLGLDTEIRYPRADSPTRVLRLRTHPLDPARPVEGGTVWTAEDVTEQRRAERELAEASEQAQAASRAKSAFLATMSHEIRTPLNGVVGLAQMLQLGDLPAARRDEYLAHLIDSARQLQGIVSDVLDLSKIEAGEFQLELAEFELLPMLRSVFETFAPLAREKGLAIALEPDPAVPARVLGDALRLRQILANYLSNAIKFTERGQIVLRARPLPGARLRLEVEDSGIGVPPEARGRLFRPFVQADGSTTRRFGGTGLGLSISAELASRMGGDVGLEPGPGGLGSRFWVQLPLPAVAGAAAASAAPAPSSAAGGSAAPLAGRTVLVAEDNPVNTIILVALLERLGAQVLQAEDGAEAVALLERRAAAPGGDPQVDLVLMDLHMPEMDGWAATRAIRSRAWGARLPVVACSADVLEGTRRENEEAGLDGHLAKPIEEAQLLRLFETLPHRQP